MIKEFALDPQLLASWKDFRYFVEQFGVDRGRLISRYPKRWKALVYEALRGCPPVEKKKIEERLCRIDDRLLPREHLWRPDLPWLPNALEEHARTSFDGIVAGENPDQHPDVLVGDEVNEDDPRWRAETQRTVPRRAADLAACVAPFLRTAREVILVDPHLQPQERRFQRPLREFLAHLPVGSVARVEFHTGDKWEEDELRRQCENHLPGIVPVGIELCVVRWPQKSLHNRYVLTDRCGALFATGLDEAGVRGTTGDKVVLLSVEQHRSEWSRHRGRAVWATIVGTRQS